MALSPLLSFLIKATRKSTRLLSRDYFELENLQNSKRPTTDFVSRSKAKVEEDLRLELSKYPSSVISSSLGSYDALKAMHFIIDPLDGERNLGRAIPFFASIVVACEHKDGALLPLASVISFPALGEIVYADHGRGAYSERSIDNSSQHALRLRVSANNSLDNALIATNITGIENSRVIGCDIYSAYLVASGKADVLLSNTMSDAMQLAAGQIIHEAGGRTHSNKEIAGIVARFSASNGCLGL